MLTSEDKATLDGMTVEAVARAHEGSIRRLAALDRERSRERGYRDALNGYLRSRMVGLQGRAVVVEGFGYRLVGGGRNLERFPVEPPPAPSPEGKP